MLTRSKNKLANALRPGGRGLGTRVAFALMLIGLSACTATSTSTSPQRQKPLVSAPVPAPSNPSITEARVGFTDPVTTSLNVPVEETIHTIRSFSYDTGMTTFVLRSGESKSIRRWGVMAAPTDSTGPVPVVVIIHGAHSFCSVNGQPGRTWPCPPEAEFANHQGLTYLVESLAKRGFVAFAPGVNAEFAEPSGSAQITAAIIDNDLKSLANGAPEFAQGFDGKLPMVDPTRLVLIGHSRGGSTAVAIARGEIGARLAQNVNGLVLLAPNADTVDPALLPDLATVVVVGTCDGDTSVDGAQFATGALATTDAESPRKTSVALALVQGATHNGTNSRLTEEPMLRGRPDCDPGERLTPEAQRMLYAGLVSAAARQVLNMYAAKGVPDSASEPRFFDPMRPEDDVAVGLRVVHIDPAETRTNLLPQWGRPVVAETGFTSTWCPAGRYSPTSVPGTERCHRLELSDLVGVPAGLELSWDQPGASLQLNVSSPQLVARAHGSTLVLRLLADPIDTRLRSEPVVISLKGTFATSEAWSTEISIPVTRVGDVPDSPFGAKRGALLWSERRLPFNFPLNSLTLSVVSPASGSMLLIGAESIATP